ncbi:hypothetical protein [Luteimonas fraxinea]|uniref:hypothetical protein n=1 Tax=Luteimonas fraxinea TaxID=2901869 RepID=UPI001E357EE5|nr:hypothetical protein [Luteimonas fraxinea]MCD9125989.1 hypothetical protein [Luteimonas fraxinea]
MQRRYVFRSAQTVAGFLGAALELRVRAALEDTVNAGYELDYDPLEIETTSDKAGDKVEITLTWGDGVQGGAALEFVRAHNLTAEPQI